MKNTKEIPPKTQERLSKEDEERVNTAVNEINLTISKINKAESNYQACMEKEDGITRRKSDITELFENNGS